MADRRLRRQRQSSDGGSVGTSTEPRFLVIGRITRPHGVLGEVCAAPLTDDPTRFEWLERVYLSADEDDPAPVALEIEQVRWHGALALLKLVGYDDRTRAELLRGQWLMVPVAEAIPLAEGEYFLYQLLNLAARTDDGQDLGRVVNLLETGASTVLVIQGDLGEILVPNVPAFVTAIDFEAGLITIHPIPGLLP